MATSKVQASSGFVDNWQAGRTLAECNLRMLDTEDSCDVTFRCGAKGDVIKAHRYVLMSRSCVFHAMFSGPLSEKSDVSVPEIEATFFKQLLIYLYTNDVTVNADNATALLYAARKYAISGLENKCKEFLEKNLNLQNACVILEASHHFDQKELCEKALTLIKIDGERSLQSSGFLALSQVLVNQIIESDDLNAEEHVVFTAVNNWAEAECGRQGREVTPEAKRSVLGNTLMKVRFPLLNHTYVVDKVKASGLLTDAERLKILEFSISPVGSIQPYNGKSRYSVKVKQTISRRRFNSIDSSFYIPTADDDTRLKVEAICFRCNNTIVVSGYQLFGEQHSKAKVDYRVISYFGSEYTVLDTAVQKDVVYTAEGEVFDVIFPHPVSVAAGEWYTLVVQMIGPFSWIGEYEMSHVVCDDGVEFYFRNSSKSNNGTGVDGGQIPSLIYSVL